MPSKSELEQLYVKHKTFLEAIDSMTPAQQKGLKSWLIMREEERTERENLLRV